MKNLSVILSSLALIGVIVLFGMNMSDNSNDSTGNSKNKTEAISTEGRIAYVNIDTLEANYEYLKKKSDELEARKKSMSNELERSQKQFQQDVMAAERKAQAGTLTQAEYESTAKRLQQMKQSLEAREAALTEKLYNEQDEFNKDLQHRLDAFLEEYNKDKGYDYILSYSGSIRFIMLANDNLDITADVVKGMNEEYEKNGEKDDHDSKSEKK